MKVGTLYSGIGGAELGLSAHGWVPVWQAEIDPFRQKVLRARFPDSIIYPSVEECTVARHSVDLIYTELPDRDIERWWGPLQFVIAGTAPQWCVVEFSPTADMSPIIRRMALWGWGFRFFTLTARLATPSLAVEEQDVRTRAVLVASSNRADCDEIIRLKSTRIEAVASGPALKSLRGSVEMEEESRALPPGWTCVCERPVSDGPGSGVCVCDPAARKSAIREATSPVIGDLVGAILAGHEDTSV